jgi:hypothetical protein
VSADEFVDFLTEPASELLAELPRATPIAA